MSRAERIDTPGFLAGVRIVAAREFGAAFDASIALIYLVTGLVVLNGSFMNEFFLSGRLDMRPLFELLLSLAVALLPAMSMRLWAEDRKARTFELWMTLPLRPMQVVLGKFVAALALWTIFLAGTLPVVAMLVALGEPDLGLVVAGYLAALLLGALFLSFGLFLSSLTGDQIVAFVTSVLAAFLFVASGHPKVVAVLDGMSPALGAGSFLEQTISVRPRYERVLDGLVELSTLVWFGALTSAFLWLNGVVVARFRS